MPTLDDAFEACITDAAYNQMEWSTRTEEAEYFFLAGAAAEREQCARVCEDTVTFTEEHYEREGGPCGWCKGLETAAERIRQRGEETP